MDVDSSSLASLMADPEVESVEEDRLAKPGLTASGPLVRASTAWALGNAGQGVAVAILDTGVDNLHPFLGGRVVDEACFSTNYAPQHATSVCPNRTTNQAGAGSATPCSITGCAHGTHVAGIAAGYQPESFAGMAVNVQIIAIQVFSRIDNPAICGEDICIRSYTSDQLRALDHVMALRTRYTIASANMSLGGSAYTSQASCDAANPAMKHAINTLRTVGIATVIAAGNDGFVNAVSQPGCISSAISVGNTTNDDELFMPSNIARFVTMMAPGTEIYSSLPGGDYGSMTGTSMAAPHVAGALAVLRQASPTASVDVLLTALRAGGRSLSMSIAASGRTYNYAVRRLDIAGAVSVLKAVVTPATGWWWNPSEPGRGFSLEARGGRIFLGAFLYDTDGAPLWYSTNGPQSGSTFSGTLAKFGFGQTLAGAYRPAQLLGTAGTATISFSSSTAGTLTWPGGTIAIQRFPIDGQSVVAPQSGAPETGWWWNASEPGNGWFFEVQGSNIFLSGYLYDGAGRPIWYTSGGPMLSTAAFEGDLQEHSDGPTLTDRNRTPTSSATISRVSLRFTSPVTATLTLPQGRTFTLTRFSNF